MPLNKETDQTDLHSKQQCLWKICLDFLKTMSKRIFEQYNAK